MLEGSDYFLELFSTDEKVQG